jgi:hypothetical protein
MVWQGVGCVPRGLCRSIELGGLILIRVHGVLKVYVGRLSMRESR